MSETKKCTQCGQEKPIEDFSKSYKNLCKTCVAENEKRKRDVKKLAIESFHSAHGVNHGVNISYAEDDIVRFTPLPRLYVASFALQGLLASGRIDNGADFIAKKAVEYADALLNELNITENEDNN